MTDAEKREKVIRGLECCSQQRGGPELCEQCPYDNEPFPCANALIRDTLSLLKEQEARWVPVTEDNPHDDELYYITILEEHDDSLRLYTDVGWYCEEAKGWVKEGRMTDDVIAWMPKPKPYEPLLDI